jgi:hypothetical protein
MTNLIDSSATKLVGLIKDLIEKADPQMIDDLDSFLNLSVESRADRFGKKSIDLLGAAITVPQLEWQGPIQVFAAFNVANSDVRIAAVSHAKKFYEDFEGVVYGGRELWPLVAYDVQKAAVDGQVISAVGGDGPAEISLEHFYGLHLRQCHGQQGALLTNGRPNWVFAMDKHRRLRTLRSHWRKGWMVHLNALDDPGNFRRGDRIFANAMI